MFCNIYIILAIFGLCQEVIFCVPCNCGLGNGVDVCTAVEEARYPLVVRPHTLPKVDIAAVSPHHHHHHGPKRVIYENIETGGGPDESNIAPLQPVGDLCTCGKTVVKPANVPVPACSGCNGGSVHTEHSSSHHHHSSGSAHHHHHVSHGGPFHPHGSGPHNHEGPGGPFHPHGSGSHQHEGPGGPFYSHGSGPHHGPGSAHDHHHHHSTRYDEDHNKVHKVGFGHKGSHVHHDDFDIKGHRRGHGYSGPYVQEEISHTGSDRSDASGPSDSAYYQVGGPGPQVYAPDSGPLVHPGHSTQVGDFHIDYPICGLPVMHQPKVRVFTSQVPADAISKAIVRNELSNKQAAVEHLQFGTRTLPREETSTDVESQKDLFAEESYYKHNGETLELAKLYQETPVEEVEIEEEEELEPEPQQVVIQPISYHSIGFVPTKIKPHKFITPVVTHPEPVHEVVPTACGVDAPPHCRDGYKSGNVIIKNVPISSEASEPTCDEVEGNAEDPSGTTYTYSQSIGSSSSSTSDSHSSHYRRTGCSTCGF